MIREGDTGCNTEALQADTYGGSSDAAGAGGLCWGAPPAPTAALRAGGLGTVPSRGGDLPQRLDRLQGGEPPVSDPESPLPPTKNLPQHLPGAPRPQPPQERAPELPPPEQSGRHSPRDAAAPEEGSGGSRGSEVRHPSAKCSWSRDAAPLGFHFPFSIHPRCPGGPGGLPALSGAAPAAAKAQLGCLKKPQETKPRSGRERCLGWNDGTRSDGRRAGRP